jgi:hypothetical protein
MNSLASSRIGLCLLGGALFASACADHQPTPPTPVPQLSGAPCVAAGSLQLSVAQDARIDCGNGGTIVTVAANGASYLVVPQLPVDRVSRNPVSYRLSSNLAATVAAIVPAPSLLPVLGGEVKTSRSSETAQRSFDRTLRQRALERTLTGEWSRSQRAGSQRAANSSAPASLPATGTTRDFRVLASPSGQAFTGVTARLAFAGQNLLLYVDTLAPAGGFTADQVQAFGALFDRTLYPIDTAAFGPPSDADGNGRVIMLMTPVVNELTPTSTCEQSGFVAGFFDEEDLGGAAADSNSNHGEVFYSIVPDPSALSSCAHSIGDVALSVPATFMHELQHLISFSQHFVVHQGRPEYGWLDEGLSIVAEELGSVYYEQKCPGTACRTNPAQLFPDSSQGFIQGFLFDSYEYALRTDTASVTLHSDSDGGFSWRGGDWLLMRWLGDHFGAGFFRKLDESTDTGVANIESASGQSFPTLFATFGMALFADSLPGLPRSTAPSLDRFVSRNVRQLWARLFATSPSAAIPRAFPILTIPITADTTIRSLVPGTSSYFRLDTPPSVGTVSIQFAAPGGGALPAALKPQLVILRLPPGQ